MGRNIKRTDLDWNQALKECIDSEHDALRIITINPSEVKKEEVDNNLKELIGVLKNKENTPLDNTNFSVLEKNIEKLAKTLEKDKEIIPVKEEKFPKWIALVLTVQTLCLIGLVVINVIKH